MVIPTYNEKDNIQKLIRGIQKEFKENNIKGEIIVVDDNSPDGTGKILEDLRKKKKNLKVVHRKGKLGLSSAVLEGWEVADGEVLGVMDADLSHPPEKIKELFQVIEKGEADFAIGSRYVKGGKIEGWGPLRKLMSKTATLLSRVYTKVKDPMTGFFIVKKDVVKGVDLNPRGFKILLEILIKGKYKKFREVPITFVDRQKGKSKAGMKEILYYLQNLVGYLPYKKNVMGEFFKFGVVGIVGMFVNLAILYYFTEYFGIWYMVSAVFAFLFAMTLNFLLNKIWTFKESFRLSVGKKYLQFSLISVVALVVNLVFLYLFTEVFGIYYLISQVFAIGIAFFVNFAGNKIWTF